MSTKSFTKDIMLSEEGNSRLMKILQEPCEYCKDGLEVETIIIDGMYYTVQEDTLYCPFCGRKLENI
jgi:hypothetical protein